MRQTAISTPKGMFLAALLALGPAPALAQQHVPDLGLPDIHDYRNDFKMPEEPQAKADAYRLQGRCDIAINIYRALINQGTGYELSEFNMGVCLQQLAAKATDPATAAAQRQEAAGWMLKAANKGLPNAQNGLISVYLDGVGVPANPVEAGKWSLLYHGNSARRLYGLPDVAPALQARLDAALDPGNGWAQAQAKADAWSPAP
jgi:hypothetical protein